MGIFEHIDGESGLTEQAQSAGDKVPALPSVFDDFELYFLNQALIWRKIESEDYETIPFNDIITQSYAIKWNDTYYCGNKAVWDRVGDMKTRAFSCEFFNNLFAPMYDAGLEHHKVTLSQSFRDVLTWYWAHAILGGTFISEGKNETTSKPISDLQSHHREIQTNQSSSAATKGQQRLL